MSTKTILECYLREQSFKEGNICKCYENHKCTYCLHKKYKEDKEEIEKSDCGQMIFVSILLIFAFIYVGFYR